MNIKHKRLRYLADQTDVTVEQYKQNPASEEYAKAKKELQSALDY